MKTLQNESLISGIEATLKTIKLSRIQLKTVAKSIQAIIGLEDELKGSGGNSIRAFYQECHGTFLVMYEALLATYESNLTELKSAVKGFESDESGVVVEGFLHTDLQNGLKKMDQKIDAFAEEVSTSIAKISEILSLSVPDQTEFHSEMNACVKKITKTIEDLHTLDSEQTNALGGTSNDATALLKHINVLKNGFTGGSSTITTYLTKTKKQEDKQESEPISGAKNELRNQLMETDAMKKLKDTKAFLEDIPLSDNDMVSLDLLAPIGSIGNSMGLSMDMKDMKEAWQQKNMGVRVKKSTYINPRTDKKTVSYKIKQGRHLEIKGKKYDKTYIDSQRKRGTLKNLKVAQYVDALEGAKASLKTGPAWLTVGVTTGLDMKENIQNGESAERIVGDAVVDIGMGAAGMAIAGAATALAVGTVGAPLLVGAGVGFVAATAFTYFTEGLKAKVGKEKKSLSDLAKDGVCKGLKTISSWWK
ncbi:LXG domain-containing protein [Priestia koreensis]|uniref:LXG domain-containing protein n=1 Tax=Priestia koreensis TaxID=284581 RepID=A0A0M0KW30_9BACI|nr:LXG domain-containing protein [Priestia koreensis]KOO43019.1 hypothetical protein AMD01_17985 [Priestia koreensis]